MVLCPYARRRDTPSTPSAHLKRGAQPTRPLSRQALPNVETGNRRGVKVPEPTYFSSFSSGFSFRRNVNAQPAAVSRSWFVTTEKSSCPTKGQTVMT